MQFLHAEKNIPQSVVTLRLISFTHYEIHSLIFSFKNKKKVRFKQSWKYFQRKSQYLHSSKLELSCSVDFGEGPSGKCTALDSLQSRNPSPRDSQCHPSQSQSRWSGKVIRLGVLLKQESRDAIHQRRWAEKCREMRPFSSIKSSKVALGRFAVLIRASRPTVDG